MKRKSRIVIADDHPAILQQVISLLESQFDLVGVVSDGMELLRAAERLKPDLVVTDLQMPCLNGIDAGQELLRKKMCKAVVLLTMYEEPHLVDAALKAGILGFVLKASAAQDLIPAIRAALSGQTYLPVMARSA
ncbi:MAG TPA: response regulator transcription factor [Bryobacteraceae bacterium]|nr:response regulator transcription factor [Bryobacteraceae bacterium]